MTSSFKDTTERDLFGPPGASSPPRRRRRGLLDASLMVLLVYGVYAKTPIGAVAETALNVARGQDTRPSWFATFKGRELAADVNETTVADAQSAQGKVPAPVQRAAELHKVDPELLATIVSQKGTCTATDCTLQGPPRIGLLFEPAAGKATINVDELGAALAAGEKELGDPQLALEALYAGPIPVKLARDAAARSGLAAPDDIEVHGTFFTPSVRRGPLQEALPLLAIYRLRTLAWPAAGNFRITSPFGHRTHPVTGQPSFHNGTDLGTPVGTPLLAAHHGTVKRQSRDSISGNYVVLDLGLGLQTTYCHMNSASVVEKERVRRLQVVGQSGATGRITGPHLHYILRIHDEAVDAEQFGESPTRRGDIQAPTLGPLPVPEPAPVKPTKPTKPAKGTGKGTKGTKQEAKATPPTPAEPPPDPPAATPAAPPEPAPSPPPTAAAVDVTPPPSAP
jgi:murein DD-endopeptidase MepM/ murein hydrolase activator NlpD